MATTLASHDSNDFESTTILRYYDIMIFWGKLLRVKYLERDTQSIALKGGGSPMTCYSA